jgi:hypothetical protein
LLSLPRTGFLELRQSYWGVWLPHEPLNANGSEGSDKSRIRALSCHAFGRAAEDPSPPGKADNHHCHRADHYTPDPWFDPWRHSHDLLLIVREKEIFSQLSKSYHDSLMNSWCIIKDDSNKNAGNQRLSIVLIFIYSDVVEGFKNLFSTPFFIGQL